MKLKKLEITNYRSLKKSCFCFESKHHVYTGRNGSGKTHLLEALNDFFDGDLEVFTGKVDSNHKLKLSVNFELTNSDINTNGNKFLKKNDNILIVYINRGKIKDNPRLNNNEITFEQAKKIHEYIKSFFNVIYSTPFSYIDISSDNKLKKIVTEQKDNVHNVANIIEGPFNVKVKFAPTINIEKREGAIYRELKTCNTGALRDAHLEIYKSLHKTDKKTIFIYDEFETHYHPQMTLKQYFKTTSEYDYTFISTHCPELVNTILVEETIKIHLIKDNVCNEILGRESIRNVMSVTKVNSKIVFSDFIIFVEGRFDTYFIEKVFTKLGIKVNEYDIYELSGASNHTIVQQFMEKNKLKNYIFILDQDMRHNYKKVKKVSDNKKLKRALKQDLKKIANLDQSEINKFDSKIDDLFQKYAYSSPSNEYNKDGYPIYERERRFNIPSSSRGKYIFHDYDLEVELIRNNKGKFAIKYVMNSRFKSVSEITPSSSKSVKNNIMDIIDRYAKTINDPTDLPPSFLKLYKAIKSNNKMS